MDKCRSILLKALILVLFSISVSTDAYYSSPLEQSTANIGQAIEGKRAQCFMEGQPIAVNHIDRLNCYACRCKNGFVECKVNEPASCPPLDGCFMVLDKTPKGCCQTCKGCTYNGTKYRSHTEWADPKNPCKVMRCEAGVVTESNLQCYTPCSNPLPPEPGKCCPTCPECRLIAQKTTDNQDVISDDPCLKCRCINGKMTCAKKACPVLQCPPKQQLYSPEDCCPRCNGTRILLSLPKHCTTQDLILRENQKFNIDKCTSCRCVNETSICHRASCPVLDCAPDLQKSILGSCCKKCIMPEEVKAQCSHAGKYYEDGQSWKLDNCRSCKCQRGMPSCAMTKCNNATLSCAPGTRLTRVPGECCQKCEEVEGVCMVYGDPHYKTFDGKIYSFHGAGKYHLVTDCHSQSFFIRVANDFFNKSVRNFIQTKRVAIRYGDLRLNVQQKGKIKINREKIKLPYNHKDGKINIKKVNGNVEIVLQNGVKIVWSGKSFLEISVPSKFKNRLCGLCGNFNGDVQDELRTKRGQLLKDNEVSAFALSWCAGSRAVCSRNKILKQAVCLNSVKNVKTRCRYLNKSEYFGECGSRLNNLHYYRTCKLDMCKCPSNKCYCDSLLAYARECARQGVKIPNDWKEKSLCYEDAFRKKKIPKAPSFTLADIEKYRKQKHFNRTRNPILIN